jgi:hypothetical protein
MSTSSSSSSSSSSPLSTLNEMKQQGKISSIEEKTSCFNGIFSCVLSVKFDSGRFIERLGQAQRKQDAKQDAASKVLSSIKKPVLMDLVPLLCGMKIEDLRIEKEEGNFVDRLMELSKIIPDNIQIIIYDDDKKNDIFNNIIFPENIKIDRIHSVRDDETLDYYPFIWVEYPGFVMRIMLK